MLILPLVVMVVFIKAVFGEDKKSGIDWDALPSAMAQLLRAIAGEIGKR